MGKNQEKETTAEATVKPEINASSAVELEEADMVALGMSDEEIHAALSGGKNGKQEKTVEDEETSENEDQGNKKQEKTTETDAG